MTLAEVKREYGSFRAAVEHYAGMGCSITMAAKCVGMNRANFRRHVKRFGLKYLFPQDRKEMLPECRGVGREARAEANRRRAKKRILAEELLPWVHQSRTSREFRKHAPYSLTTVVARFGTWAAAKQAAKVFYRKGLNMERFITLPAGPFAGQPCRVLERDIIESVLWLEMPNGEVERVCGRTVGNDLGL